MVKHLLHQHAALAVGQLVGRVSQRPCIQRLITEFTAQVLIGAVLRHFIMYALDTVLGQEVQLLVHHQQLQGFHGPFRIFAVLGDRGGICGRRGRPHITIPLGECMISGLPIGMRSCPCLYAGGEFVGIVSAGHAHKHSVFVPFKGVGGIRESAS